MIPEYSPRTSETRSRTRCHYGQAAEPNQNRCGLLSEIKTPIKNELFTDHYTIIPGKELGRYYTCLINNYRGNTGGHLSIHFVKLSVSLSVSLNNRFAYYDCLFPYLCKYWTYNTGKCSISRLIHIQISRFWPFVVPHLHPCCHYLDICLHHKFTFNWI